MARTKLTNKQKKKIIADYIQNQNYSETAKKNKVAVDTVRRIILTNKDDENFVKKSKQKKEEDTQDILEYMNDITQGQKKVINLSLEVITEMLENRDKRLTGRDIAMIYGVIFDKALKYKEIQLKDKNNSNTEEINNGINNIVNLLNNPKPVRTEEDLKDE